MKKIYAQCPEERNKECYHDHTPYRGSIPCTGPRICTMCGTLFNEQEYAQLFKKRLIRRKRSNRRRKILNTIETIRHKIWKINKQILNP